MQVISFMNMKGGVGKTTLSVNIAYRLAYFHKKKVLIVDGDPQFNATQYLLDDEVYIAHLEDEQKGTLRDIFVPKRPGAINTVLGRAKNTNKVKMPLSSCTCSIFDGGEGRGKLDLIPSTLALIDIETSKRQTESKLKNYIHEKANGYDYVLIDCPPTISIFTQAAILASNSYAVQIKPDPLSVIGLPLLERWLDDYTDDAGIKVKSVGLIYTMVRGPTPLRMREIMTEIRAARPGEVFASHLSQASAVSESVEAHKPVFFYKKNSKSGNEILQITQEFLDRTSGA